MGLKKKKAKKRNIKAVNSEKIKHLSNTLAGIKKNPFKLATEGFRMQIFSHRVPRTYMKKERDGEKNKAFIKTHRACNWKGSYGAERSEKDRELISGFCATVTLSYIFLSGNVM